MKLSDKIKKQIAKIENKKLHNKEEIEFLKKFLYDLERTAREANDIGKIKWETQMPKP